MVRDSEDKLERAKASLTVLLWIGMAVASALAIALLSDLFLV
jgi:hypothetical protein